MSGRACQVLVGLGVSPGVALGRAVSIESAPEEIYRLPLPATEIVAEIARLREAIGAARQELRETRRRVSDRHGDELAAIFEAQELFLKDESFVGAIERRIRSELVNAEWAVHKVSEELAERFAGLDSEHFRHRSVDLIDASRFLLRWLGGISHHELSEVEGDVIVVARDLTPSEAVRLGRQGVVGFVIESGGRTSHTTIIARSLHLPMIAALPGVTQLVTDDDPMIVDGGGGRLTLHPDAAALAELERARRAEALAEDHRCKTRGLVAETRDGERVRLEANIDLPEELDDALRYGAEGIGLYRSEFLYIEKSPELPSEEEQLALYRRLLEAMAPHSVVIRTFDLGGRKLAREVLHTDEENPVLGLRGIRLTLARREIFRAQLRALLRAAASGRLRVLLPLVTTLGEVREFREFAAAVAAELAAEGTPHSLDFELGAMIEVPAAALLADALAAHLDFFSIGTNDLIQYSLAVDRNNEHVAHLYRPFHPAILKMIRWVVEAAGRAGIDVSVCGEMAADPRSAALLVGMGLRRLSVSPSAIPEVKDRLRRLHAGDMERIAISCLELASAQQVEERLDA